MLRTIPWPIAMALPLVSVMACASSSPSTPNVTTSSSAISGPLDVRMAAAADDDVQSAAPLRATASQIVIRLREIRAGGMRKDDA
jgi:hypothetical protein